ncbi:MAG: DUF3106 domain-containing protein [Limisphaerales bacterium]
MPLFLRNRFGLAILIGGAASVQIFAQLTNAPVVPFVEIKNKIPAPPLPPTPQSPIDYLRELLAMNPAQREKALAAKSPEQKRIVLAKLREYEAMTPEERQLRLGATQLRWQLIPLMRLAPIARLEHLAAIPAEERSMIENRLRLWDQLPVHLQKEFLENETIIHYFLSLESSSAAQRNNLLESLPAATREKLEADLARWRLLPAGQRQQMCQRFNQFFNLTEAEKKKTLNTLSPAEQRQMENTLQTFANLSAQERTHCIESFRKFARLTAEEREQFLKNAERWRAMSPSEREAWRQIVQKAPPEFPPLPPGFLGPTRTLKLPVATNSAK